MAERNGGQHKGKVVLASLNAKYIHSNLAIRYLEAYYRKHEYEEYPVELKRTEFTINQQTSQIIADLYEEKADIVGFSCYIWNIEHVLKIVRNLKKVAPQTVIVLGGPEVSFDAHERMKECSEIDFIVCGEGEYAFAEIIKHVLYNENVATHLQETRQLPTSVCYRDVRSDSIVLATEQGQVQDISEIPSPYQVEFDAQHYAHRIVYYEASRGCPYSCQYCLSSAHQGVRFFPIERVKKDLLQFIEAEVKQVKFVDRTFNCASEYAMEIVKWIVEHQRGKTNFHLEISADLLKQDLIEFLRSAPQGLFQFEVGVQSTNEATLKAIQRKTDFTKLKKAVEKIQKGGNIHQHLDLIVGLPHEGYLQFSKSFNDVYELKPDKLQMGFLKALKGAGIRQREDEYGLVYTAEPPYEVLQTKDLSYGEIITLKEIEHILDHYYNSHQFDYTLILLQEKLSLSPFAFYEAFAAYSKHTGMFERAHSQAAMYDALYGFAKTKVTSSLLLLLQETMKFDFARVNPHGKIPDCLTQYQPEGFKKNKQTFLDNPEMAEKYFPQYATLNMRNKSKRSHLEVFQYDVIGSRQKRDAYYLFVYKEDPLQFKRADWYDVTSYFIEN